MRDNDTKVIADNEHVFAVKYTMQIKEKLFFPFFATGYRVKDDVMEFYDSKVPGSIVVGDGIKIEQFGQVIKKPILDKKLATIFLYKVKKPAWFDKSEEDVLKYLKESDLDINDIQYINMDGIVDPLLDKVINKL